MDIAAVRGFSDEELTAEQAKAGEALFRIRFQKSLGNQEGVKNLSSLRVDIARIKTIARERALSSIQAQAAPVKRDAPAASQRTARKTAKKV